MSQHPDTENPLLEEGQYSGKIFWLNLPIGKTLDLEKLQEQMSGRSFMNDISDRIDRDVTYVPQVFEKDGNVVRTTNITEASIVTTDDLDVLTGSIVLDDVNRVSYRDQEILIMDTTSVDFLIFEFEGHFYLAILSRREVAEGAASILRSEYDQLGSMINPTRFSSEDIEEVRRSLEAGLRDTTISDYPEEKISRIQITGKDLEKEEEFKRQRRRGEIKTHMIQTKHLTPEDDTTTISISRDGLVRVYSSESIATYMSLLTRHVLPHIHRDAENSPNMTVYEQTETEESILKDVTEPE